MTSREQQAAFAHDLRAMVKRYSIEFDMTYSEVVGCLECCKIELVTGVYPEREDKDDGND